MVATRVQGVVVPGPAEVGEAAGDGEPPGVVGRDAERLDAPSRPRRGSTSRGRRRSMSSTPMHRRPRSGRVGRGAQARRRTRGRAGPWGTRRRWPRRPTSRTRPGRRRRRRVPPPATSRATAAPWFTCRNAHMRLGYGSATRRLSGVTVASSVGVRTSGNHAHGVRGRHLGERGHELAQHAPVLGRAPPGAVAR